MTRKWYVDKPELSHKPYSTPMTNDDILDLLAEDTGEHDEEKEKQQEKKDEEKKDEEKGKEMDQEEKNEEEREKSPEKLPEGPHGHIKLKRAEAFKIVKANSTEAPEPPSSPKVKPKV